MPSTRENTRIQLRTEHVEQLDAVPIVAAETVVCRHFKIVDDDGRVRIDATVRSGGGGEEAGPRIVLRDMAGYPLASVSISDHTGPGGGSTVTLFISSDDGSEQASLTVGGMRGPSLDLEVEGGRAELVAMNGAAALVAWGSAGINTAVQLVPGEQPETIVESAGEESEATS